MEALEGRALLAYSASFTLVGTEFQVQFTDDANQFVANELVLDLDPSGFLRHNRDAAPTETFDSPIDLDSTLIGTQALHISQIIEITVNAGIGNDIITVAGSLALNDVATPHFFLNGGEGNDIIHGSAGDDSISGDQGNDQLLALGGNDTVNGGDGNDEIYVGSGNNTASDGGGNDLIDFSENSVAVNYTLGDGNNRIIGTAFHDTVHLTVSLGARVTQSSSPNAGVVDTTGGDDLQYASVEQLNLIGTTTLVVRGTDAADDLTLLRNGSANRVTVNEGTAIDFTGFTSVDLDGRNGDDHIAVSPVGLVGVTSIGVTGGEPGAGDTLVITGTTAAQNFTYVTGSAFGVDGGRVLTAGAPTVEVRTIRFVQVDGRSDGDADSLTLRTDAGPDSILLIPGTAFDQGTLHVRSTSGSASAPPLSFRALGRSGTLALRSGAGAAREDELEYAGTDSSDEFVVTSAGQIRLNDQIVVDTGGVAAVVLDGFDGDDRFEVASDHPFTRVTLDGGSPSDSDVVVVTGGGGDLTIDLEAQTITEAGSGPIDLVGIEEVIIDANGANIVVNGTAGDDLIAVTPTATGAGSFSSFASGAVVLQSPLFTYSDAATLTFHGGDGTDVLRVLGSEAADTVTSGPSSVTVTRTSGSTVTVGNNFERLDVVTFGGNDSINLSALLVLPALIDGGDGNDIIVGTPQADVIDGGLGDDTINGAAGADRLLGGLGRDTLDGDSGSDQMIGGDESDTFVWDPGDGSDLIEGGGGLDDVMVFNGSLGDEIFTFNAIGTRLEFLRNLGNIDMDVADVEQVTLNTVGGADQVIVNDITQTDVRVIQVNLGADAGASLDRVTLRGRNTADDIGIAVVAGAVQVHGLAYDVQLTSAVVAEGDRLVVESGGGNDHVKAESNVEATVAITLDGGTGNDHLSADAILIGGPGDDFLEGGPGDDQFFGNDGDDIMIGLGGADTYDGGSGFDSILIRGTAGPDRIDVDQPNETTVRHAFGVIGVDPTEVDTIVLAGGTPTVERVLIETLDSADIVRVTPSEALLAAGTPQLSVTFTVDGGNGLDRLVVQDAGLGDTVIYREGPDDQSGTVTIGGLRPVEFREVEQSSITPLDPLTAGTGADGAGRLVVFPHDVFEENDSLPNATFLGAGETINVDRVNIDPGADALFGAPADENFYRLVASTTGVLDIQVYFRQLGTLANGRAGLPGDGNLDIEVRDESGDLISGFGANDATDDERVRIPVVAGETYYLRVRGATPAALNTYDISVVNTAPPVPFDLELLDNPVGDPPPQNSDTGRSQFDNITRDATPTIVFRLDDAIFLNDLPGNATVGTPPDEVIPIPFQAAAGAAGYRVAVFDEGSSPPPGTQTGTPPQEPLGFATLVSPGVYQFTTPLLSDGSHFLTARVQMVDPSTPSGTGFGPRSESLEIVVDTVPPPVFFGSAADPNDGLVPDPGVTPQPDLFVDNKTNDRTPSLFGTAEANTVIRVFADLTPDNGVDNLDVLLGLTVTLPEDGTNQFPNGQWRLTSTVDLNDPDFFPLDGLRRLLVTAEDVAGNTSIAPLSGLDIFLDTQGPQVSGVFVTETDLIGLGNRNTLVRFNSAAPTTILATTPITGLVAGETVVGIDVRPADRQMYAIVDGLVADRIYRVNPFTGVATFVSTLTTPLSGTSFGVDFNPVVDRLRIVSDADQNLRVDVDSGNVTVDTALNPGNPNVVAAAYINNVPSPLFTALYTIDSNTDTLNLQNPPNAGTQGPIGPLGVNVTEVTGFDIAPGTNRGLATMTVGGVTGLYSINLTTGAATKIGNVGAGATPVRGVTALAPFDLFDPKPSNGPTPLISKLTISLQDFPPRIAAFPNPVVNPTVAVNPGHFTLVGDANGIIPIASVTFTQDPIQFGQAATGTLTIMFVTPLPDDRFTLTLSEAIVDDAGNLLDGDSNATQPLETPTFPTGDGQPGGDFLARFTVDSRPEIGTWAGGTIWVDTNGNGYFDPENTDRVNRDIVYAMGLTTDDIFAGNFGPAAGPADGFDKLAAYGMVNGNFRWLIDTDNDGVADISQVDPTGVNGLPVAGNFDGNAANGDEVAVFDGQAWHFDTDHDFRVGDAGGSFRLTTSLRGFPIVGDFNGDGRDDLATWTDDRFQIDLAAGGGPLTWDGTADFAFRFGFIGVREQPVAADMNRDGFTDLGLWVPDREGQPPREGAEWYFLISNNQPLTDRIRFDTILNTNVIDFEPVPFGQDIYQRFGDEFALPILGNFDPPIRDLSRTTPTGNLHFNTRNPYDVNADGLANPRDLLVLLREIHKSGSRVLTGSATTQPYLDVKADGIFNPRDIAAHIAYLLSRGEQGSEDSGEGESWENATDAVFASWSTWDSEDEE